MIIRFNWKYFGLAVLLFGIEVLIALFVKDRIIRPYVGDVLVVMLIYCFVKSFLQLPVVATAIGVLLFAYGIEALQFFNFIEMIGLENCEIARVVLGHSYEFVDLLAYTLGILLVLSVEFLGKLKL
jgi:uncharacterized protein DUF2809